MRVCVCVTANVGGGLITDACGIPINVLNWNNGFSRGRNLRVGTPKWQWGHMSENAILWNSAAREKPAEKTQMGGKPGGTGVLDAEGALALSWLAYPLYLMTNKCQRLSCLHPVKLWGWWQVQA